MLLVLAFALVTRSRLGWAAASLAGAVLLKQFALVALPFLALMAVKSGADRAQLKRAGLVFAGVLLAAVLPFLIADPGAFYDDTVKYGAGTYRIVGYGLSAILVRLGVIDDRDGSYPFALIALLTWVPLTVWLLMAQRRATELWVGAAGVRRLDPLADVHRPDLQQLLPAVAAHGSGYRDAAGGRRARNANCWARPVT